ncbi:MAG TPA: HIT family protein [Catalimonadaceae bacterium]|nr:HIT family protein [Catalimonadaceae bacterium]HPI11388.1 HIT family protein [Catalimonadaceae bacterium]
MASIFRRIIQGEIPCYKVSEDDQHLAFLDINPVALGHVLVVPKSETDYIFDITDPAYQELWVFARKVAVGLKKAVPCLKVGVTVIGLEVPHAHIHLVPMQNMSDMNFSRTKLTPSKEELETIQKLIAQHLA